MMQERMRGATRVSNINLRVIEATAFDTSYCTTAAAAAPAAVFEYPTHLYGAEEDIFCTLQESWSRGKLKA